MKFRNLWYIFWSGAFGGLAVFQFGMGRYGIAGFDVFACIFYLILALNNKENKNNDQSPS